MMMILLIIIKLSLAEQISKNLFTAQYKIKDPRRFQNVVSKRFKSPLVTGSKPIGHIQGGWQRPLILPLFGFP